MDVIQLYHELKEIVNLIPADFGGGCPVSKSFLMAYIALEQHYKTYVEIGVYRGRSFFPMGHAMQKTGGMAYGIDPYDKELAREFDLDDFSVGQVNQFIDNTDFHSIYEKCIQFQNQLGLSNNTEFIRESSSYAVDYFIQNSISIDMLHIDGNHDTKHVMSDVKNYTPLLSHGGCVVIDDINWYSVKPALNYLLATDYKIIFIHKNFAILKKDFHDGSEEKIELRRYETLFNLIENFEDNSTESSRVSSLRALPIISVIVITYNHEKYISECVEGVLSQKGNFRVELIIGNDSSTDHTALEINRYLECISGNLRFSVKVMDASNNLGMISNFKRCLESCTGDYFSVCDGDDYWIEVNKLQMQLDFMKQNPFCSLCFHDLFLYFQETGTFSLVNSQKQLEVDFLSTKDIIKDYVIGNISSCFYDSQFLKNLPEALFDLNLGDWMFNIFYSQFGQIGHLKKEMSVYRKHNLGISSGLSPIENCNNLYNAIYEYNEFLDFSYDVEFSRNQQTLEETNYINNKAELLILDDLFPNPLSAFRWQEFISYLQEFSSIRVASVIDFSLPNYINKSQDNAFGSFKKAFPEYSKKISNYYPVTSIDIKVIYSVFLNLAYKFIDFAEKSKTPFVFTLYPGGGFQLNNQESDRKLSRILFSPCFRKVIVTQKISLDYLLRKKLCNPDQIEYIYGAVIPQSQFNLSDINKRYFGFGKDTFDICFTAFRYTEKGVEKGYDIFIKVAHRLIKEIENVQFHVVGNYDESIIDVSQLMGKIKFYGPQKLDWFDQFYIDKDIILSPNIMVNESNGQFDGFPTASCVDAGLRKTAIFCTDVLGLNDGYFLDGEEIVIIPHETENIVSIVKDYYHNPEKLRYISENGRKKILQLFGYEAQILPRINLLKKEIELSEQNKREINKEIGKRNLLINQDAKFEPVGFSKMQKTISTKINFFITLGKSPFSLIKNYLLIRNSHLFDVKWYLEKNPDVKAAKVDPYLHYLRHGGFEGRNPSPYFSSKYYLDSYIDVKKASLNPLVHFLKFGRFEHRRISPTKLLD